MIGTFLLALALFAAHALRYCGIDWLDRPNPIDLFRNCQRLLVMIVPFGPIPLDLEGFHESPFNRTLGKSSIRIIGR